MLLHVGCLLTAVQPPEHGLHVGEKLSCKPSQNRKGAVIATDAGTQLSENAESASDGKVMYPLQALGRLVAKEGVEADGIVVVAGEDRCLVWLKVYFPGRLWNSHIKLWRKSPAAAVLFSHLFCVDEPVDLAIAKYDSQTRVCSSRESFSLGACFGNLPHHAADLELPTLQAARGKGHGAGLGDLPNEVLLKTVVRLAAPSVASLACTCRFFKTVTDDAIPGLLLSLYPHQRAAVRWMLQREAVRGPNPDPCWRQYVSAEGLPFWGSAVNGDFTTDAPRPLQPCRGGFFCDEPGLGKTITGLALVLKSQGTVPVAPEGAPVSLVKDSKGKPAAFYTLPAAHTEKPRNAARSLRLSLSATDRLVAGAAKGQRGRSRGSTGCADSPGLRRSPRSAAEPLHDSVAVRDASSAPLHKPLAAVNQAFSVETGVRGPVEQLSSPLESANASGTGEAAAMWRLPEGQQMPTVTNGCDRAAPASGQKGSESAAEQYSMQASALGSLSTSEEGRSPQCAAAGGIAAGMLSSLQTSPSHTSTVRTPHRMKSGFASVRLAGKRSSAPARCVRFAEADPDAALMLPPQGKQGGAARNGPTSLVASEAGHSASAAACQDRSIGCPSQGIAPAKEDVTAGRLHGASTATTAGVVGRPAAASEAAAGEGAVLGASRDKVFCAVHGTAMPILQTQPGQDSMRPETGQTVLAAKGASPPASSAQGSADKSREQADEVPGGTAGRAQVVTRALTFTSQRGRGSKRGRQRGSGCGGSSSASGGNKAKRWKTDADAALAAAGSGGGMGEGDDDSDVYVQCDLCNKWRILPKGHDVEEDAFWMCTMHPEPRMRFCSTPEEVHYQKEFTNCCGYVAVGEQPGTEANMQHFRLIAAMFQEAVADRHSVLWWLAKQDTEAIATGIRIPRHIPGDVSAVLTALGLQAAPKQEQAGKAIKSPGQAGGSGSKGRVQQRIWRQPWYLSTLRLDTAALLEVLSAGPEDRERRIFMSPATLLIVPAPLIQHWLHQVELHTRPGSLRVLVLASDSSKSVKMPQAHHLAWDYDLVITTFSRLSSGWSASERRGDWPLLQVHWLRIILDEGHMLGASLSLTNKLQMACALRAERRWVMTGTPTPSTPTSDVAHLQPLLAFLHHDPYGTERKTWEEAVQKPFEGCQPEGRRRLMDLLSCTMIRAAKANLITIPPLFSKVVALDFAPAHARSYNELVEVIGRNLLLADWFDEDHVESLLSARNGKWAKEMLRNVKLSCCVAGNCNLQVKESDVQETLELLVERHHMQAVGSEPPWVADDHPLARIRDALYNGCECQKCGAATRLILVTPCAHLLCSGCISANREKCTLPGCTQEYVMQRVEDPARKETNPNPKWPVPTEVIEWQASYTQKGALGLSGGQWNPNWQVTKSSKCVHLLKRLYEIGAAEPPYGSHLASEVRRNAGGGMLREGEGGLAKAIVFSQFWHHILLVGSHLRAHGVALAVLKRDLPPAEKAQALDMFQNDDECGVLLMDEAGAVGLDLSFASHVFLMEPIEDSSLQQQVVSRAHRMGATRPVHVEILVMKGTAEEELVSLAAQEDAEITQQASASSAPAASLESAKREKDKTEAERRSKRNRLLLALRRIREASLPDYHDLPMVSDPQELLEEQEVGEAFHA